jgi:hypothetical protein
MSTVVPAMEGCYGIFVNTDTMAVGERGELYTAIKMFEQAHRIPQMRHFIWSSLDYGYKVRFLLPCSILSGADTQKVWRI